MAILLTGGTGKTSVHAARLLQDQKIPFLLASRRGEDAAPAGMPAVKFDWLDSSTYGNPFEHEVAGGKGFSAIYLIAAEVVDPEVSMNAFIDFVVQKHSATRFVLLTDSLAQPDGHRQGKVWQHMIDIGVDYCVLRPTWFLGMSFHQGFLARCWLTWRNRKFLDRLRLHGQTAKQNLHCVWRR